jgi:hypothetical protein
MRILRSLGLLLLAAAMLATPKASSAQIAVGISVHVGPPVLPVYVQPACPAPGYIWTPGYWAYGDEGYYWVPGTWVMAPEPGFLWTPGYWGFAEGAYVWHAGYWGPHVGFYGGINYGFGYTGVGFFGGEWRGREFVYNRAVTNVNVTVIHNTYNRTVVVNNVNRVSFNGPHGIEARPTEQERIAEHDHHIEARREQIEHEHAAHADRSQWASVNHGRPAVAASGRPGDFHHNVVAARAENGNRPEGGNRADRPSNQRADRPNNASPSSRNVSHNDRPPNTGNRNAGNRDNAGSRPNDVRSNNGRDSRPAPDPSRGRSQATNESHGNSHADRAPAQHSNAPHENAHSNYKPEQSKPEHGKPERP